MSNAITDFVARPVDLDLVETWRQAGYWDGTTVGGGLEVALQDNPGLGVSMWSRERPFHGTTGEVTLWARRFAGALSRWGLGPGDIVVAQLPNWIEAVTVIWGAALAGVTVAPVVHIYGASELRFILRETRARLLVTADRYGSLDYREAIPSLLEEMPQLERVVVVGESDRPDGTIGFHVVEDYEPVTRAAAVDPDSPAVIGFTSGTTSTPKGVVHSHNTLLAELRQATVFVPPNNTLPLLWGSPVSHVIGLMTVLSPLTKPVPIHLIDRWDPERVLELFESEDLRASGGTPYFLTSLLDAPSFRPEMLHRVSHLAMGGAPVPAAVVDRARSLGITLIRSYGSTEHPSITSGRYEDPDPRRDATDGQLLECVEMRIVDPDDVDLATGQPGEILSRGPDLFAGYLDPEQTRSAFRDGWFATGDVGSVDADGYLSITDRIKDIIIRGGENISALEVEQVLSRMPGVAEVAVVAAPDERMGEHVCAFLRLAEGAAHPDLDDIRAACVEAAFARQKWPEEMHVVDDFERTASGKIKKVALRDALRAEAVRRTTDS